MDTYRYRAFHKNGFLRANANLRLSDRPSLVRTRFRFIFRLTNHVETLCLIAVRGFRVQTLRAFVRFPGSIRRRNGRAVSIKQRKGEHPF